MSTILTRLPNAATRPQIALAVLAWAAALAVGLAAMGRYEFTSGAGAAAPTAWPADSSLHRPTDRPTLLVFAHPRCPCTRATLAELAQIASIPSHPADVYVLFYTPEHAEESWTTGSNWSDASAIAHANVIRDPGGVEARRFGARTSGQAMLFDRAGTLTFEGGITGGRGQIGENLGRTSISALLRDESPAARHTPVYGCELFAPEKCPLCAGKEAP